MNKCLFDLVERSAKMSLLEHFRADPVGGWSMIITAAVLIGLAVLKVTTG